MRDLAVPVLEGSITLLAIYAAGLIFVAQHIGERYTPALYSVAVRKIGGVWLSLLALIALSALAIAAIPPSWQTDIADPALLAVAIVLTVRGLIQTFQAAANRQHILAMVRNLKGDDRLPALPRFDLEHGQSGRYCRKPRRMMLDVIGH